jgi:hypothetical protein
MQSDGQTYFDDPDKIPEEDRERYIEALNKITKTREDLEFIERVRGHMKREQVVFDRLADSEEADYKNKLAREMEIARREMSGGKIESKPTDQGTSRGRPES